MQTTEKQCISQEQEGIIGTILQSMSFPLTIIKDSFRLHAASRRDVSVQCFGVPNFTELTANEQCPAPTHACRDTPKYEKRCIEEEEEEEEDDCEEEEEDEEDCIEEEEEEECIEEEEDEEDCVEEEEEEEEDCIDQEEEECIDEEEEEEEEDCIDEEEEEEECIDEEEEEEEEDCIKEELPPPRCPPVKKSRDKQIQTDKSLSENWKRLICFEVFPEKKRTDKEPKCSKGYKEADCKESKRERDRSRSKKSTKDDTKQKMKKKTLVKKEKRKILNCKNICEVDASVKDCKNYKDYTKKSTQEKGREDAKKQTEFYAEDELKKICKKYRKYDSLPQWKQNEKKSQSPANDGSHPNRKRDTSRKRDFSSPCPRVDLSNRGFMDNNDSEEEECEAEKMDETQYHPDMKCNTCQRFTTKKEKKSEPKNVKKYDHNYYFNKKFNDSELKPWEKCSGDSTKSHLQKSKEEVQSKESLYSYGSDKSSYTEYNVNVLSPRFETLASQKDAGDYDKSRNTLGIYSGPNLNNNYNGYIVQNEDVYASQGLYASQEDTTRESRSVPDVCVTSAPDSCDYHLAVEHCSYTRSQSSDENDILEDDSDTSEEEEKECISLGFSPAKENDECKYLDFSEFIRGDNPSDTISDKYELYGVTTVGCDNDYYTAHSIGNNCLSDESYKGLPVLSVSLDDQMYTTRVHSPHAHKMPRRISPVPSMFDNEHLIMESTSEASDISSESETRPMAVKSLHNIYEGRSLVASISEFTNNPIQNLKRVIASIKKKALGIEDEIQGNVVEAVQAKTISEQSPVVNKIQPTVIGASKVPYTKQSLVTSSRLKVKKNKTPAFLVPQERKTKPFVELISHPVNRHLFQKKSELTDKRVAKPHFLLSKGAKANRAISGGSSVEQVINHIVEVIARPENERNQHCQELKQTVVSKSPNLSHVMKDWRLNNDASRVGDQEITSGDPPIRLQAVNYVGKSNTGFKVSGLTRANRAALRTKSYNTTSTRSNSQHSFNVRGSVNKTVSERNRQPSPRIQSGYKYNKTVSHRSRSPKQTLSQGPSRPKYYKTVTDLSRSPKLTEYQGASRPKMDKTESHHSRSPVPTESQGKLQARVNTKTKGMTFLNSRSKLENERKEGNPNKLDFIHISDAVVKSLPFFKKADTPKNNEMIKPASPIAETINDLETSKTPEKMPYKIFKSVAKEKMEPSTTVPKFLKQKSDKEEKIYSTNPKKLDVSGDVFRVPFSWQSPRVMEIGPLTSGQKLYDYRKHQKKTMAEPTEPIEIVDTEITLEIASPRTDSHDETLDQFHDRLISMEMCDSTNMIRKKVRQVNYIPNMNIEESSDASDVEEDDELSSNKSSKEEDFVGDACYCDVPVNIVRTQELYRNQKKTNSIVDEIISLTKQRHLTNSIAEYLEKEEKSLEKDEYYQEHTSKSTLREASHRDSPKSTNRNNIDVEDERENDDDIDNLYASNTPVDTKEERKDTETFLSFNKSVIHHIGRILGQNDREKVTITGGKEKGDIDCESPFEVSGKDYLNCNLNSLQASEEGTDSKMNSEISDFTVSYVQYSDALNVEEQMQIKSRETNIEEIDIVNPSGKDSSINISPSKHFFSRMPITSTPHAYLVASNKLARCNSEIFLSKNQSNEPTEKTDVSSPTHRKTSPLRSTSVLTPKKLSVPCTESKTAPMIMSNILKRKSLVSDSYPCQVEPETKKSTSLFKRNQMSTSNRKSSAETNHALNSRSSPANPNQLTKSPRFLVSDSTTKNKIKLNEEKKETKKLSRSSPQTYSELSLNERKSRTSTDASDHQRQQEVNENPDPKVSRSKLFTLGVSSPNLLATVLTPSLPIDEPKKIDQMKTSPSPSKTTLNKKKMKTASKAKKRWAFVKKNRSSVDRAGQYKLIDNRSKESLRSKSTSDMVLKKSEILKNVPANKSLMVDVKEMSKVEPTASSTEAGTKGMGKDKGLKINRFTEWRNNSIVYRDGKQDRSTAGNWDNKAASQQSEEKQTGNSISVTQKEDKKGQSENQKKPKTALTENKKNERKAPVDSKGDKKYNDSKNEENKKTQETSQVEDRSESVHPSTAMNRFQEIKKKYQPRSEEKANTPVISAEELKSDIQASVQKNDAKADSNKAPSVQKNDAKADSNKAPSVQKNDAKADSNKALSVQKNDAKADSNKAPSVQKNDAKADNYKVSLESRIHDSKKKSQRNVEDKPTTAQADMQEAKQGPPVGESISSTSVDPKTITERRMQELRSKYQPGLKKKFSTVNVNTEDLKTVQAKAQGSNVKTHSSPYTARRNKPSSTQDSSYSLAESSKVQRYVRSSSKTDLFGIPHAAGRRQRSKQPKYTRSNSRTKGRPGFPSPKTGKVNKKPEVKPPIPYLPPTVLDEEIKGSNETAQKEEAVENAAKRAVQEPPQPPRGTTSYKIQSSEGNNFSIKRQNSKQSENNLLSSAIEAIGDALHAMKSSVPSVNVQNVVQKTSSDADLKTAKPSSTNDVDNKKLENLAKAPTPEKTNTEGENANKDHSRISAVGNKYNISSIQVERQNFVADGPTSFVIKRNFSGESEHFATRKQTPVKDLKINTLTPNFNYESKYEIPSVNNSYYDIGVDYKQKVPPQSKPVPVPKPIDPDDLDYLKYADFRQQIYNANKESPRGPTNEKKTTPYTFARPPVSRQTESQPNSKYRLTRDEPRNSARAKMNKGQAPSTVLSAPVKSTKTEPSHPSPKKTESLTPPASAPTSHKTHLSELPNATFGMISKFFSTIKRSGVFEQSSSENQSQGPEATKSPVNTNRNANAAFDHFQWEHVSIKVQDMDRDNLIFQNDSSDDNLPTLSIIKKQKQDVENSYSAASQKDIRPMLDTDSLLLDWEQYTMESDLNCNNNADSSIEHERRLRQERKEHESKQRGVGEHSQFRHAYYSHDSQLDKISLSTFDNELSQRVKQLSSSLESCINADSACKNTMNTLLEWNLILMFVIIALMVGTFIPGTLSNALACPLPSLSKGLFNYVLTPLGIDRVFQKCFGPTHESVWKSPFAPKEHRLGLFYSFVYQVIVLSVKLLLFILSDILLPLMSVPIWIVGPLLSVLMNATLCTVTTIVQHLDVLVFAVLGVTRGSASPGQPSASSGQDSYSSGSAYDSGSSYGSGSNSGKRYDSGYSSGSSGSDESAGELFNKLSELQQYATVFLYFGQDNTKKECHYSFLTGFYLWLTNQRPVECA
ncbi:hypothetical protein BgiMline_020445 [Biomphalaria glabrata]|nr:hypothetical protein BgiMline_017651 [Biomphalaria glabrata]